MQKPPERSQSTTGKSSPDRSSSHQGPIPKKARRGERPGHSERRKARTENRLEAERHLYTLFEKVIDGIMASKRISADEVAWGVDDIVESFHYDQGGRFFDVDYTQYENVCAYLYRYGLHGAGLVRCMLLKAASRCVALKKVLREEGQEKLRVVSLGGGPGNDALGFCSALVELGFHGQSRPVDITVVDMIWQWKECVDRANRLLRHQEDLGDLSEMFRGSARAEVKFRYARLPELDTECEGAVARADVILMSKVMSSFEGNATDTVQKLRRTMKDSALLVLIDSPFRGELWNTSFEVLYLSREGRLYQALKSHTRFERRDYVQSKARVAVLRKCPDVTLDSDSRDTEPMAP